MPPMKLILPVASMYAATLSATLSTSLVSPKVPSVCSFSSQSRHSTLVSSKLAQALFSAPLTSLFQASQPHCSLTPTCVLILLQVSFFNSDISSELQTCAVTPQSNLRLNVTKNKYFFLKRFSHRCIRGLLVSSVAVGSW